MYSLTGFGKSVSEIKGRKVVCELKSVNHRFLDLTFRMPKLFNMAEDSMRKHISSKLSRGHVDIFITYENNRMDTQKISINESIASLFVDASRTLSAKYELSNNFAVAELLRSPDCISIENEEEDDAILTELVMQALVEAVSNLIAMRKNEGHSLYVDITSRLNAMRDVLEQIKELAPAVVADYATKLKKRIQDMLADIAIDEARLINEVAFFSDKCSIDEEMTRLTAHLDNAEKYLFDAEPIGRKMDFLVQEMNREINTIGSKAQDIAITNYVVFLKNELEKIREQVQNIE